MRITNHKKIFNVHTCVQKEETIKDKIFGIENL